jgi:glycosyltransferase involved in cell wall biosynthesis
MKILLVNHTLKAGGAERQFVELVKGLHRLSDVSVEVFLFNDIIEYDELIDLPVKIHTYSKNWALDPLPFKGLNSVITDFSPDIVHSWHWVCNFYLLPLSYRYRFLLVDGSIRDANTPPLFSVVNIVNRLCWLRTHTVVANSRAGLKAYGVAKNGRVIYNGLDTRRFEQRKNLPVRDWSLILKDNNCLKVGMVARFHNHKDYRTYLEVADALSNKYPHVYFFAIGEGPHYERFRQTFRQHQNIVFTGRISFVEQLILHLDVGVLLTNPAYHAEGTSNALMEFMCAAKPVIASRGGGTAELIEDRETGLLIQPHAHHELEEALSLLLEDPQLRRNLGKQGGEVIKKRFTFEYMVHSYLELYQEIYCHSKTDKHALSVNF